MSLDAGPTHARQTATSIAICGDVGPSPWTKRRSEVTCEGCRAEIDRRLVIPCDFCEVPAATFFPRGGPAERNFACAAHEDRARRSLGVRPGDSRTDSPLPGRDHFEKLGTKEILARWRAHRDAHAR
ncbi:MAG TPA: hypothetical protein VFG23_05465 [Polyangia bacterium]|nr:hypothetical protein [Polyangia bacterium]